jgi:hypothetical protein
MRKLFKVEKRIVPEWGASEKVFVKYFLACQEDTVRSVVYERYGKPHYCEYDRQEVDYEITEVEFEEL